MTSVSVPINLGELRVSQNPREILVCNGLGSCIGLVFWEPEARLAGMAHIVLPEVLPGRGGARPAQYAELAVPALLKTMIANGAVPTRVQARMAGGAAMFNLSHSRLLDIGRRNIQAVHRALAKYRVPLLGSDTGGNHGRTLSINVATGIVSVITAGQPARPL